MSAMGSIEPARGASFRRRLFAWTLLIALVPVAVVAWQGYRWADEALVAQAREQVLSLVGSRRNQIESWLRERSSDLEVVGQSQECVGLVAGAAPPASRDSHAICQYLEIFRRQTRSYQALSIHDLRWSWVAGTQGSSAERAERIPAALREKLVRGPGQVTTPVHPLEGGGIGLAMGNRLTAVDGRHVGYVVTTLNLSRTLGPLLARRTGLGRSGTVYLVGEGGRFLTPPRDDSGRVLGAAPAGPWRGEGGTAFYRDHRGVPVIGGHARVAGRDWIVVAEIELSEALGWLDLLRRQVVAVCLALLVVVLFFSFHISRKLARPLRELADVARRIGAGSDERVARLDGREADEVGRAFNQMLDDLAEARDRLARSAALAAVGEISASVVHEMRNPLSSVKLNLQALARKVQDDPAHEELGRIALEQVSRLEAMLRDLLGYGKPLELELATAPVADLLADAVQLASGPVTVEDRTGGGTARIDRQRLAGALGNLLANAQAAGPAVAVRLFAAWDRGAPPRLVLEVADDGPGVPEAIRDKLFLPFFTTRVEGTGLGLAIVRKVVEHHGGTVRLADGGPPGATFRIELPA